jgi:hypothetical protein
MRLPLMSADRFERKLIQTRPVCESCKHQHGFKAYYGKCETHAVCDKCKCPAGTISMMFSCPLGFFLRGMPSPNWKSVMKELGHARQQAE